MFFRKNKNKQDASSAESDSESSTKEQTFVSHLVEMRDRLLKAIACVFVVLLCLFPFSNFLYIYSSTKRLLYIRRRKNKGLFQLLSS